MKLFLDSANLDEVAEIDGWGVLDGATTNPTLAAGEGIDVATPAAPALHQLAEHPLTDSGLERLPADRQSHSDGLGAD